MKMDICNTSFTSDRSRKVDNQCKVSKFRNYASQIYAASATNIVKCTVGSTIGFTSVLVAELYKENAEIQMSISHLTWFSSKCFMIPVGAIFLGIIAQRIGSRLTMLISSIFYVISFLMFYFATSSQMLLAAQAISGFFHTTSVGPGITYVIEITQPPLRSALTASTTLSSMCAAFFVVLLSNFLHWRTIVLVMLFFPITGCIAVWTIPNSPHWLASKKKFSEAEAALCWLRGWTSPESIASEFKSLKDTYTEPSFNSDCLTKKSTPRKCSFFKDSIRFYFHRSFYVPLVSMCLIFILHNITGNNPVLVYSIVIFTQINAPIDAHATASIFDAMRVLGAVVCILFIHHTGKKKLMYITLSTAASAFFVTSTALLLKEYQIYPETCQWIAAIVLMFTAFSLSAGTEKVVFILNAEVFPTKYRSVGTAIGLFVNFVAQSVNNKLFLSLLNALTLPGVFLIFGVGCIMLCTVFHFVFPETEGKTLQEIEDHYNGGKKI